MSGKCYDRGANKTRNSSVKPFTKPSKGSGLLHCAALNQSDLCQEHLIRKQSILGLEQWQYLHKHNTIRVFCYKLHQRVWRTTEEKKKRHTEPWLIGLLWSREKADPFTASKLSGQLSPLQRNSMTVKCTSCAAVALACLWQPWKALRVCVCIV